jgi:hypothetical protein
VGRAPPPAAFEFPRAESEALVIGKVMANQKQLQKRRARAPAPHGRLMPYPTAATRQVVFIDRAVVPQGGCCRSLLNQVVE